MSSGDIPPEATAGIPRSVGRTFDLLEIVLARGACNLTTAATAAQLTPTTALRHLRGLEARGYLERDEQGLFSAGSTLLRLAAVVHDGGPVDRLIRATQPHIDALAAETGESCYLAVAEGVTATYVATAESAQRIRHVGWVGQSVRLDGTAIGAALDDPGVATTRTGVVEPDVTALSLALPPYESLAAAVSIIGPAHRLVGTAHTKAERSLAEVVTTICAELGVDYSHAEPIQSAS